MQTIITKYLGPTNARGSRIKARQSGSYACKPVSVTIAWDYSLSAEQNHTNAAKAVAAKLGWRGDWVGGDSGGTGLVFVGLDTETPLPEWLNWRTSPPKFRVEPSEIAE